MTIGTITALFAATATAGLGLVANTQDAAKPKPLDGGNCHGTMGFGKHFGKGLGMTDAQKEQAKLLHDEVRAQREKIKADSSLSEEAKKAKLEALREQTRNRFDEILTAEQRAKLAEMKAKGEKMRAERKAQFEKALGITEAQKAQLEALRAEMKGLRGKFENREQARAAMEALRQKMDSVLTPEQRAKLEAMRSEMRGKFGHRGKGHRGGAPKPPMSATSV